MIVKRISIRNKHGLHARPAAALARTAQSYECAVTLRSSQKSADAKSILDVLTLSLGSGEQVDVLASGVDADEAMREICKCFETGMEEDTTQSFNLVSTQHILCPPLLRRSGSVSESESEQEEFRTLPSVFDPDPDSDPDPGKGITLC